jgi:hypothetical protein
MVKERLRKKAADKGAANKPSLQSGVTDTAQSEAAMAALLREEAIHPSSGANSGARGATNPVKKSQKKKPAGNGKK